MIDVTIETKPAVDLFYQYYNAGDFDSATRVIESNPILKRMIVNADNMNKMLHGIMALEHFFYDDVEKYLMNIIKNRGEYNPATKYTKYDVVFITRDDAKEAFMGIEIDIPIGTPPTDTRYFVPLAIRGKQGAPGTGLSPRGNWSSVISYYKDDCVSYGNIIWQCNRDNVNTVPTEGDNTIWEPILRVPQQVITSPTMPEGQVSGDIWIKELGNQQHTIYKKNVDGSYGVINPSTAASNVLFNNGKPVEGHIHTKDEVGLANVDNTADKDKPVSTAVQKELDGLKTSLNSSVSTLNNSINSVSTNLTSHINNKTVHITAAERTAWNNKANKDLSNVSNEVFKAKVESSGFSGGGHVVVVEANDSFMQAGSDYICDGVDDQAEINQAILDIYHSGGGTVILNGSFSISGVIDLQAGVNLIGASDTESKYYNDQSSTLLHFHKTDTPGYRGIAIRDNCIVSNLELYYDTDVQSADGIFTYADMLARHTVIENCTVWGGGERYRVGINIKGDFNRIASNYLEQFVLVGTHNLANNNCLNVSTVELQGSFNKFDGNCVECIDSGDGATGISLSHSAGFADYDGLHYSTLNFITNNYISGFKYSSIYCRRVQDVSISNNFSTTLGLEIGIEIDDSRTVCAINNYFYSATNIVSLSDVYSCIISPNYKLFTDGVST